MISSMEYMKLFPVLLAELIVILIKLLIYAHS